MTNHLDLRIYMCLEITKIMSIHYYFYSYSGNKYAG